MRLVEARVRRNPGSGPREGGGRPVKSNSRAATRRLSSTIVTIWSISSLLITDGGESWIEVKARQKAAFLHGLRDARILGIHHRLSAVAPRWPAPYYRKSISPMRRVP